MVNIKQRQVAALRKKREVPKDLYDAVRCNVANVFRNAIGEIADAQTLNQVRLQIHDSLEELVAERVIFAATCTNVSFENGTLKADIHIVPQMTMAALVFNCTSHRDGLRIDDPV